MLASVPERLREIESLFSLYDPNSTLRQLNAEGRLTHPPRPFVDLMRIADQAHRETGGIFDPTVQVLWEAEDAQHLVDWSRVVIAGDGIKLGLGQKLTLNGIAQGFATDLIVQDLAAAGFAENALVNIGEFRAHGGPFRLGISDPTHGIVGTKTLRNRAIATSSPASTVIGGRSHLMAPDGRPPLWSSVTVEAATAALADALSTAAVFMERDALRAMAAREAVGITVVDQIGDVETI